MAKWEPKNPHPKTQQSPSVQPALHRAFNAGAQAQARKLVEWLCEEGLLVKDIYVFPCRVGELRRQVGLE